MTDCGSRSGDAIGGGAVGRVAATRVDDDELIAGRALRTGSATSTASAATLAPSDAPGRLAMRRPMSWWIPRGNERAKATVPGIARVKDATAAAAPQPECLPVATIGHTYASIIVDAAPDTRYPQLCPARIARPATARIEAIPLSSPVGPGTARAAPAAPSAAPMRIERAWIWIPSLSRYRAECPLMITNVMNDPRTVQMNVMG